MMNEKLGHASSILTLVSVLGFAVSMLLGTKNGSYASSLLIAAGFVPMICAFAAQANQKTKAAAFSAIAFAVVYAVLICVVYYTQLTTVQMTGLSDETVMLLSYDRLGLMFNLDLLGYAFMSLATFFAALTLEPAETGGRWLKRLLFLHGIFAVCAVIPLLGVFKPVVAVPDVEAATSTQGSGFNAMIMLELWCAYFTVVCILALRHFRKSLKEA